MSSRIAGIIQCKDDWGLIAVSISYALLNHVDIVYALNDSSTDRTSQGLKILQKIFPGRIYVVNLQSDVFLQEAATNIMIQFCQESAPDWIYVFDADEFLMLGTGQTLKDILVKLGPDEIGLRYQVKNYVSTFSFDENLLNNYKNLRFEAVVIDEFKVNLENNWEYFSQQINDETLNYLNIPFQSKVIFRNSLNIRLMAGAHGLKVYSQVEGFVVPDESVSAAHFSWLSRDRLTRKAELGRRHIISGASPNHGWQNQMLFKMFKEGKLDRLWERHSIPDNCAARDQSNLDYIANEEFLLSINKTLDFLHNKFGSSDLKIFQGTPIAEGPAQETHVPLQTVIALTKKIFDNCDFATDQKKSIGLELARTLAERDNARTELEQTHQQIAGDAIRLRYQDTALTQMQMERDALLNSTIWRASQPLRKLGKIIPASWRRIFHH